MRGLKSGRKRLRIKLKGKSTEDREKRSKKKNEGSLTMFERGRFEAKKENKGLKSRMKK